MSKSVVKAYLSPTTIFGLALLALSTLIQAEEAPSPNALVDAAREEAVGRPAPAIVLTTIDGDSIDLGELYGRKAIYLKFWATWCIPCQQQMPHFEHVYQESGDDLEVIAINAGFNETLQGVREFREDFDIHMPIVVDDGALAGIFDFRLTPQHIIIGKDGRISYIGHLADAELDAALASARQAPQTSANANREELATRSALGQGDMLPDRTLQAGNGTVTMGAGSNASITVFMSSWCESYLAESRPNQSAECRAVREQIETLKQQYPQARWLGVSSRLWTTEADLALYAEDNQVTLPLVLDDSGDLFRSFSVMRVPTVIVADADGRIVSRTEGFEPALADTVAALMD